MRILLVAASPSDAHLAQRTLRRGLGDGVQIVHVDRLSQALQKLDSADFDVAVLDLDLPDASGIEALQQVHGAHPDLPLLVLIDWGDDDLGVQAIQAGAQDSVIKSLGDIQRLCRSVRYALERSRIQRENTPTPPPRTTAASPNREPSISEASRMDVRAEVATQVIDDVGRLIGAAMNHTSNIERRTEPAAIRQMQNLAELVEENMDDLMFFGPGGRGRTVPAYMRAIAERLAKETRSAHADAERLASVLDEMAGAISTQQVSDEAPSPPTAADVDRLVLEVLGTQKARIDKARIKLSTDLGITEHCRVDADRMQQVLGCLVSNALDSLEASDEKKRRLLVRTRLVGDQVRIDVGDNGVGIEPAVGSQMFGFGFTTKSERDGFGLHGCATDVRHLGGQLTWQSKGTGRGAVFTVELPQATPSAAPIGRAAEDMSGQDAIDTVAPDSQDTVLGPIVIDSH